MILTLAGGRQTVVLGIVPRGVRKGLRTYTFIHDVDPRWHHCVFHVASSVDSIDVNLARARARGKFETIDFRATFHGVKGEIQATVAQKHHILGLELVVKLLDMAGVNPQNMSSHDMRELRKVHNDSTINIHPYSSKSANVGIKGSDDERSRAVSDSSACRKVFRSLKEDREVELTPHEADHIIKQPAVFRALANRGVLSKKLLRGMVAAYLVATEKLVNTDSTKFLKRKIMDQRVKETRLVSLITEKEFEALEARLRSTTPLGPSRRALFHA